MVMEDNGIDTAQAEKLHGAISTKFDIGNKDEFLSKMQTPEQRKSFYNAISDKFDIGDYNSFEDRLKKKVSTQQTTTPSESISQDGAKVLSDVSEQFRKAGTQGEKPLSESGIKNEILKVVPQKDITDETTLDARGNKRNTRNLTYKLIPLEDEQKAIQVDESKKPTTLQDAYKSKISDIYKLAEEHKSLSSDYAKNYTIAEVASLDPNVVRLNNLMLQRDNAMQNNEGQKVADLSSEIESLKNAPVDTPTDIQQIVAQSNAQNQGAPQDTPDFRSGFKPKTINEKLKSIGVTPVKTVGELVDVRSIAQNMMGDLKKPIESAKYDLDEYKERDNIGVNGLDENGVKVREGLTGAIPAFIDGFVNTSKSMLQGLEYLDATLKGDDTKKIELAKQRWVEENILHPVENKGAIANASNMLGGVAPYAMGGAVLGEAEIVPRMIMDATGMGLSDVGNGYYEGFAKMKDEGKSDEEANDYATKKMAYEGATGAMLGAGLPHISTRSNKIFGVPQDENTVRKFLAEGFGMTTAFTGRKLLGNAYEKYGLGNENLKLSEGLQETAEGALMLHGLMHVLPKAPKAIKDIYDVTIARQFPNIEKRFARGVEKGEITQQQADAITVPLEKKFAIYNAMPEGLTAEQMVSIKPETEQILELSKKEPSAVENPEVTKDRIIQLQKTIAEKLGTPLTEKEQKSYEKLQERQKPIKSESGKEITLELLPSEKAELTHYEKRIETAKENEVKLAEQKKQEDNDKKNIAGVQGSERIGEEPIQTEPNKTSSGETSETSGNVLQNEQEEVAGVSGSALKDENGLNEDANKILGLHDNGVNFDLFDNNKLRQIAKDNGIDLPEGAKNADIIEALKNKKNELANKKSEAKDVNESIGTSDNTETILETAEKKGGIYSQLAKAVKNLLGGVKTIVTDAFKSDVSEHGDYGQNEIRINNKTDKNKLHIFFHEALHHITRGKIEEFESNPNSKNLKPEEVQAILNLKRIFKNVTEKLNQDAGGFGTQKGGQSPTNLWLLDATGNKRGLANVHEFISEAFTNPEFQKLLKDFKGEGKQPNLFKQFLDAVAKMLGLKDPTILDDIFHHTEKLIDEKQAPTQYTEAATLKEQPKAEEVKAEVETPTETIQEKGRELTDAELKQRLLDDVDLFDMAMGKEPLPKEIKTAIDNGEITREQADGFIEQDESVIEDIERKAESEDEKQRNEAIDQADKLIGEAVGATESKAEPTDKGTGENKVTGIKKAMLEKDRQDAGLPPIELPKSNKPQEQLERAKELVDSGEIDPSELEAYLISHAENPSDAKTSEADQYILQYQRMKIEARSKEILTERIAIEDRLKADPTDVQANMDLASNEIARQQNIYDLDRNTTASRITSNIWGKLGNAKQQVINERGIVQEQINRIKELHGKEVPKEVQDKLDSLEKKNTELTARIEAIEKNITEQIAQGQLNKENRKPLIRRASRRSDEEINAQIKDKLSTIANKIAERIEKSTVKNFAANKEQSKSLIAEIAPDVMDVVKLVSEKTGNKLEDVVNKTYDTIKDIAEGIGKRDIVDIIAGKYSDKKPLSELQKQINDIRSQARLNERIDELEKGILRETQKRGESSEEVKKLRERANELMKKSKNDLANFSANELKKQAEQLQKKIDKGEFLPQKTVKKAFEQDSNWVKYNQEKKKLKQELNHLEAQTLYDKKNLYMKTLDQFNKFSRLGLFIFSTAYQLKLGAAALSTAIHKPIEDLVGTAIKPMVREIADRAPIEGRNINAEATAEFYKNFSPIKILRGAYQILSKGETELSRELSSHPKKEGNIFNPLSDHSVINWIADDPHKIIKNPIKQGIFDASLANYMNYYASKGMDINDPVLIEKARQASYMRAEYEIFMGGEHSKNAVAEWFKKMETEGILDAQSESFKTKAGGNLKYSISALKNFIVPIASVPANILNRTVKNNPVSTAYRFLEAMKTNSELKKNVTETLDNLTEAQADIMLRDLKKGAIGSVYWTLGFIMAGSALGGFFNKSYPDKKRDEKEKGHDEMEIFGKQIPHGAQHAVPLQQMQMAATFALTLKYFNEQDKLKLKDDFSAKDEAKNVVAGGAEVARTYINEHPLSKASLDVYKAIEGGKGREKYFNSLYRRSDIPQFKFLLQDLGVIEKDDSYKTQKEKSNKHKEVKDFYDVFWYMMDDKKFDNQEK